MSWLSTHVSFRGFFFTIGFYFPLFYLQLDSVKHGVGERFSFYVVSLSCFSYSIEFNNEVWLARDHERL